MKIKEAFIQKKRLINIKRDLCASKETYFGPEDQKRLSSKNKDL